MPRKVPSSSGDVGKTVHNVNTTVSEKAKVGKSKPIEVKRQPQKHYFNQFSRAKTIISYLEDRAANQITAGSFDEDIDQSYAYSQLLTPAPSGADSKFQEEQRFRSTNEVVGAKKLMSSISSSSLLRREMISVQLSTPFMPNFAQLYHQTMQQLQEVCCFILSLSHNMDREKEKHRFLHALLAMRDISLRMVEYYASGRGRNCGQDWDDFTDAVAQIPNSLDFIDTEPFTRYSGLHFSYNPFACAFDLSGELSVSVPLPEAVLLKIVAEPKYDAVLLSYLPRELVVNEETFHRQLAANRALVSFCSAGPTQSKTTDDRASNQSKLAFLLFGSEKQQELHQNEDQVRALAKLCTQRRLWSAWRRAHFVRRTGAYLKMLHREHTLRHWWMNMIHYCDQIRGLRAVLASQERMQLAKGWRTWCAVVEWWKHFDRYLARKRARNMRNCLQAWRQAVASGNQILVDLEERHVSFALQCQPTWLKRRRRRWSNSQYWRPFLFFPLSKQAVPDMASSGSQIVAKQVFARWRRLFEVKKALSVAVHALSRSTTRQAWQIWAKSPVDHICQTPSNVGDIASEVVVTGANPDRGPSSMQSPRGLAGMFTSFFGSFRGAKLHPEGAPAIDGDPIDTLADPLNTDDSSSNLRTSRVPFATSTGASFFSQGEVEL